tara:strand:+ start:672 stop:1163 length:492 start_codon:yes stop_codon:yes gene_type:complete
MVNPPLLSASNQEVSMSRILYRPLSLQREHSTVWYAERAQLEPPCHMPRGCRIRHALGRELQAIECEPILTAASQFVSRLFTSSEVVALRSWLESSQEGEAVEFIVEEVRVPLTLSALELEHVLLPTNGLCGLEEGWGLSFDVSFRHFEPGLDDVEDALEWVS